MSTLTFKEGVEKLPSPILVWSEAGEKFYPILWQYTFIVSTLALLASVFVLDYSNLSALITVLSLMTTFGSGIAFLMTYGDSFDSGAKHKRIIRNKISEAASHALDSKEDIKLSEHISLYRYRERDDEYLSSLTKHHIKWAKKYYNKQLKKIEYDRTEGFRKNTEDLDNKVAMLDSGANSANTKRIAYHLQALEELSNEPSVTPENTLEKELQNL